MRGNTPRMDEPDVRQRWLTYLRTPRLPDVTAAPVFEEEDEVDDAEERG